MDADGASTMTHPACQHRFHTACALNFAQYDLRCAVCRGLHESATQRVHKSTVVVHRSEFEAADASNALEALIARIDTVLPWRRDPAPVSQEDVDAAREMRRYNARRTRAIRNDPELQNIRNIVSQSRVDVNLICGQLESEWAHLQRSAWRNHPAVCALRKQYTNKRRKYNRWTKRLESELEARIGQRPSVPQVSE